MGDRGRYGGARPSGTNGVLSYLRYSPASLATMTAPTATFVDADATNLVLPDFVVPLSGAVRVTLSALGRVTFATQSTWMQWSLRDASGNIAGTAGRVAGAIASGDAFYGRITYDVVVTGLTPGDTITGWKWGIAKDTGAGGTGVTEFYAREFDTIGAALMTVAALPLVS